jgi:selenide,water dikinase
MPTPEKIRLTEFAKSGGCAAKLGAVILRSITEGLQSRGRRDPNLLVGFDLADDAGVYRLRDDLALVQTVDFITPLLDDPYDFGRIAATNALSDVYAMGGRPLTCLNICCFPKEGIDKVHLRAILEGAADVVEQAGAVTVGGHTIVDAEVKFGLSVTGTVHPARILTNSGAVPGQALVLTKPIGLGVVMNAGRRDQAPPAVFAKAVAAMTTLNRAASEEALAHGATGATDVTGFGFTGHAWGLARASHVELRVHRSAVPILEGALELHRSGIPVSQCAANRANVGENLFVDGEAEEALLDLFHDPQTSGGLLVALPAREAEAMVAALRERGSPDAAVIGEVVASDQPRLRLVA